MGLQKGLDTTMAPVSGIFALHSRSQHSAISADNSASNILFDLYIALPTETQSRHLTLTGNPLDASASSGLTGELGAPVSKDKLALASHGVETIAPGAVGSREQGQSVASDNTNTRIEMLDTGEIEIVSDEADSKIFQLKGNKLVARMIMTRDAGSSRFNIKLDNVVKSDGGTGGNTDGNTGHTQEVKEKTEGEKEDKKLDPGPLSVDDFITPEFAEVISGIIASSPSITDMGRERLSAISKRLGDKKLTNRDVVFVLKFISGGEQAALDSDKKDELTSEDIMLSMWGGDRNISEFTYLDQETGDTYKVVPSEKHKGMFSIPRFQFISRGTYNDEEFNDVKIDQVVSNFSALTKTKILDVPTKVGHHKEQKLLGNVGELAYGWADNAWSEITPQGKKGFVSLDGIPQALAFLIKNKALKNRSAEIFKNVNYNGKDYGPSLKAISFLGASTPAVLGMQTDALTVDPAVQMYTQEDGSKVIIVKPNGNNGSNRVADSTATNTISLSTDELNKRISDAVEAAMEKARKLADIDKQKLDTQVQELSVKLKSEQDARRKDFVKSNKAQNEAEFDVMVKAGSMLPVQKDDFIALCTVIDGVNDMARGRDMSDMFDKIKGDKDTLEFSVEVTEADKKVEIKAPLKGLLFRFLKGQKQIDLSQKSTDGKNLTNKPDETKKKISTSDEVEELTRKIMKDESMSYVEAFQKAWDKKFEKGAADAAINGATSVPITSEVAS